MKRAVLVWLLLVPVLSYMLPGVAQQTPSSAVRVSWEMVRVELCDGSDRPEFGGRVDGAEGIQAEGQLVTLELWAREPEESGNHSDFRELELEIAAISPIPLTFPGPIEVSLVPVTVRIIGSHYDNSSIRLLDPCLAFQCPQDMRTPAWKDLDYRLSGWPIASWKGDGMVLLLLNAPAIPSVTFEVLLNAWDREWNRPSCARVTFRVTVALLPQG